jgi:hypothetical protein
VTISLAVVCESPADQRTGCDLADRVFCAEVPWLEPGLLEACRKWRGFDTSACYVLWTELRRVAQAKGIRIPHGHFEGEPGKSDAAAARRAIRVLMAADAPPDAIVLLRDEDADGQRRKGIEQARQETRLEVRVVVGVADAMRESWVLAGFDPKDDAEQSRLQAVRRELGFDPRENAHRLRAKHRYDKNNPKRVLDFLTEGDFHREASCWRDTDLELLKRRGKDNGLSDYLDEVKARLVPMVSAQS